jgi:hypothetical protein
MRRAAKRDANEPGIISALRAVGCLVQPLSGPGVPDLLVWSPWRRGLMLLEVKDGGKVPSARELTEAQRAWHGEWSQAPVEIVNGIDDALVAVGQRAAR